MSSPAKSHSRLSSTFGESMATQPQSLRMVFGPFEVNPTAGELRKSGLRVRLSRQPFQILLTLLETPGEVVTREQLRARIWPEGTFVDFEHGLGAAMNKLRRALNDSEKTPSTSKPSRDTATASSQPPNFASTRRSLQQRLQHSRYSPLSLRMPSTHFRRREIPLPVAPWLSTTSRQSRSRTAADGLQPPSRA
jgi:hypothetical protein